MSEDNRSMLSSELRLGFAFLRSSRSAALMKTEDTRLNVPSRPMRRLMNRIRLRRGVNTVAFPLASC